MIIFFSLSRQARARVELREKATQSDAEDVVDIMKHRYALYIVMGLNKSASLSNNHNTP